MKNMLQAVSAAEMPAGAPREFRVFPLGEVDLEGLGSLVLDGDGIAGMIAEFQRRGNDMVIDYEHQTTKDIQAPAAGWVKSLEAHDDGLWARVEWTERAASYLAAREYRYFSPVFFFDRQTRRILQLEHIGLTNYPRTNHMTPLAAKLALGMNPNEEEIMDPATLKSLLEFFGLKEGATPEEWASAIAEKGKALAEPGAAAAKMHADLAQALGLATGADLVACVMKARSLSALEPAATDLARQVAELREMALAKAAIERVDAAINNGQATPAEMDAWGKALAKTDPCMFDRIVGGRAKDSAAPLGNLPGGQAGGVDPHDPSRDPVVLAVAKQMGVSAEDLKKYGKAQG